MPVVIDLDGVVWLAGEAIPGGAAAVDRLRAVGEDVWFVTNSSYFTVAEQEARLAGCGIEAGGRVLTSAMAAARLLVPGSRAMVCGGEGLREATVAVGVEVVDPVKPLAPVDAVLVGFTSAFDFAMLDAAAAAVRGGARLIGTNIDTTFPTPDGLLPGGGALLAAVAAAGEAVPVVAGKPEAPMVALVHEVTASTTPNGTCRAVVGDRLDTDGAFAAALGWDFVLVRSDSTSVPPVGTRVVPDLAAAVGLLLTP